MKDERYKLVEKWVQKAQEGDQKAKEMLLLSFKPLMLSMVQKYVYNPSDYEDAGQDACCAFLESVRDFDPEASVYFHVFIRLRLENYFKKRREGRFDRSVKPEESLDREIQGEDGAIALMALILDPEADVEAACLAMEQKEDLAQAFKRMTSCQKEVFCWRYEEKGSFKQQGGPKGREPGGSGKSIQTGSGRHAEESGLIRRFSSGV